MGALPLFDPWQRPQSAFLHHSSALNSRFLMPGHAATKTWLGALTEGVRLRLYSVVPLLHTSPFPVLLAKA